MSFLSGKAQCFYNARVRTGLCNTTDTTHRAYSWGRDCTDGVLVFAILFLFLVVVQALSFWRCHCRMVRSANEYYFVLLILTDTTHTVPHRFVTPMSSSSLPTTSQCTHSPCSNFDTATAPTSFNGLSRLHDDPCKIQGNAVQSSLPGMHKMSNFYHCNPTVPEHAQALAHNHPTMLFRDGYGSIGQGGKLTDTHSSLRNGDKGVRLTNKRGPQQLAVRPIRTVPYMGRGQGDTCMESSLKEGVGTFERRQCNTLAEIYLPHQYTPLIECLHGEVQNPVHILHEANQKDWVRGGYPSRQWVHQQKFNKQCPQRGGVNTV